MLNNINKQTAFVKQAAARLGFDACGIAAARVLDDDARRLETWLRKGMHGSMSYMENNFDLRIDPSRLVPGAKSVITLLLNYYPAQRQEPGTPKIAKYAFGNDYHEIIRPKLREFLNELRSNIGQIDGRGFVDSAPVLERSWAQRTGLGWIGKNGNLITKNAGSFFFIATLIVDVELEVDLPTTADHCGTCTRCVDACPTEAILPNKVVDGSKCISYFTIELKDAIIPDEMQGKFDNWMFGCDVCQDVCPWNRFATPHRNESLPALREILNFSIQDWSDLSEESFKNAFRNSAIKRSRFAGIQRNLKFIRRDHE